MDVAADDHWLAWLGVAPARVDANSTVEALHVPVGADELLVTWDEGEGSVRFRWPAARPIVDVTREGVTLLTAHVKGDRAAVVAEYRASDFHGRTSVGVSPTFSLLDHFLSV